MTTTVLPLSEEMTTSHFGNLTCHLECVTMCGDGIDVTAEGQQYEYDACMMSCSTE